MQVWRWIALVAASCATLAAEPLRIVTSFLPAYCIARNVAGEHAMVENLLPGSADPHDHQLSPSDLAKLKTTDVLFVNGLGLESFLDRPLASLGRKGALTSVALAEGLASELILDAGGTTNVHIWLDPKFAMRAATNLAHTLGRLAPEKAAAFQGNAERYVQRLGTLDQEIRQALEPVRRSPIVTQHNAFPYFARAYGLTLAGVVEETAEVAPTPRALNALLKRIREAKATAMFGTTGANPRLAKQIARDAGLKFAELDPIETGELTPDSYEQAMRRNLKALTDALR